MKSKFQALYEGIKKQLLKESISKEFKDIEIQEDIVDKSGKIWNIYATSDVECEISFNAGERESEDSQGEPSGWELTETPHFSNFQIIDNDTEVQLSIENTDPDTFNFIKGKAEDLIMSKVSEEIEELDPEEEYFDEPDPEPDFDSDNYDYDGGGFSGR